VDIAEMDPDLLKGASDPVRVGAKPEAGVSPAH
jgi:hypothetical protein